MKERFADSFYYIALLVPSDQHHSAAITATKAIDCCLVTTAWILVEVADALSAPVMRKQILEFLNYVQTDPHTTVIPANNELLQQGIDLYGKRLDKDWSLTDRISSVSMKERGITEAYTGDHHFQQAGFFALLHNVP